ncbi:FCS-Like Zinc finger 15-like [Solanum pennellii]|uniref:FCS-Like Zinc finger 15-like n=1 Tax=Solanum pennellii TaxID=28526 RepID=A0ABM1H1H7_SOLPN|nr:FCS-Like Zinc finger 15-like [Solanum pennellii]
MGFTKLKEECTKAHHEVKSKQRDVVSSFSHQNYLKDPNFLKSRKIKSIIFLMNHIRDHYSCNALYYSNCFLKCCFFCYKPLDLRKEVYMYRGELGFCSVDCRNRQIYLDELKKIETFTKKILASLIRRRRQVGRSSLITAPSEDYRRCDAKNQVTFIFS